MEWRTNKEQLPQYIDDFKKSLTRTKEDVITKSNNQLSIISNN